MSLSSSRRMPGSGVFNALDAGMRLNDELIRDFMFILLHDGRVNHLAGSGH